jgi:hypothetical protein
VNKGAWQSVVASSKQAIPNNREAWSINVPLNVDKPVIDVYATYVVDGIVYYDDNNGAYYTTGSMDSTAPPWVFRQSYVALVGANYEEHSYNGTEWFNGSVVTRNLGSNQSVKVIYTLNNWATQSVIQPTFLHNEPNSPNLQKWVFYNQLFGYTPLNFPLQIQFKVEYELQILFMGSLLTLKYVDDNYGKNYKLGHLGQINKWTPAYETYD